ncbi:MAG: acyl carrier protein [Candidatus Sungbacteria bacterium]|uniref:Acyl carrier protein n=1 Tax=Candidatus Sungiibacteriota bacterium TaxID=2750080 RepID=A0A9D6LQI5_9BACT|nr:acyl carrier protein [Candidatus Sungbacteria bacterium]
MSKLSHIFSSILGIDESRITPDLSPNNTSSWDSLNAIILLTEIEKAFATKFDFNEAMSIKNFGDVTQLIESKGLNPHA